MKRSVFTTLFEDADGGALAFNTRTSALARLDAAAARMLRDGAENDADRAIAEHTAAIRRDSKNVYAYYSRGNAYAEKGDTESE